MSRNARPALGRDAWRASALAGLAITLLASSAQSQTQPLMRRARLMVENVSLHDALLALQRSAGVSIAFSLDMLPRAARVSCPCSDVTVAQALATLLRGTPLRFEGTDTRVLILPTPVATRRRLVDLRGRVYDARTRLPVPDALVDLETGQPAMADASGMFRVRAVTVGVHRLRVRKIGYEPRTLEGVTVADDTGTVDIALDRTVTRLPDVVIAPGTFGMLDAAPPGSASVVTRQHVQTIPQVGEDMLRAMSRLPGVASSDVSARLSVRGGHDREVSIRLDGLELHDPYHLNDFDGVFGVVDLNALGAATLKAGGFGVEYGGKSAAVVDLVSSPVEGMPKAVFGASISNLSALQRGQFAGDRGAWLVSGRRGALGLLMDLVRADKRVAPQFYDAFAKVTYQPTSAHTVSARILHAGDDVAIRIRSGWDGVHPVTGFEEGAVNTRWASTYGWVSWDVRPASARVTASVMAWTGHVGRRRAGSLLDLGRAVETERAVVDDHRKFSFTGARASIAWAPSRRILVSVGAESRRTGASYAYSSARDVPEFLPSNVRVLRSDTVQVDMSIAGRELAAWGSVRAQPLSHITVEAGLRYDQASPVHERHAAPRVLATMDLGRRTTLQASVGRYVAPQGVHELSVGDQETELAAAELTTMVAAGASHRLGSSTMIRADVYRRITDHPRPQFLNLEQGMAVFPETEADRVRVDPARGRAQGFELSLQSLAGATWNWAVAYALAQAEDNVSPAQRCGSVQRCGEWGWVSRNRDQRHSVSAQLSHRPNDRWHVTAAWLFHTGWPATAWTNVATSVEGESILWTRRFGVLHGERLAAYHRLDLRATRTWQVGRGRLDVFVDVFNAYNRANETAPRYGFSYVNGYSYSERRRGESMLPLLPTVGLRYQR